MFDRPEPNGASQHDLVHLLPHAPGFTLSADGFMNGQQLVGFHIATQAHVFMHDHEFHELALVLHGSGLHVSSVEEKQLARGTVIYVPPGVSHGYRLGKGLVVYNCMLRAEAMQFDLPWVRRDEQLRQLFGPAGLEPRLPVAWSLDEDELARCLAHLDAIREQPSDERSEAFDLGHLLLALDVLARHAKANRPATIAASPQAPELIAAVVDLFDQDLARRWSLEELSKHMCVGSYHLVRQFSRWTGVPPMTFLNLRRAERAALLLATTDDPVSSVGLQVGWPRPSQFSRRFRQHMGVSPRAYRTESRAHHAAATLPPRI